MEGELYLQAAQSLHRNCPGLCDLSGSVLPTAVPVFYILPQPLLLQRRSGPQFSWQEDCLTAPSIGV